MVVVSEIRKRFFDKLQRLLQTIVQLFGGRDLRFAAVKRVDVLRDPAANLEAQRHQSGGQAGD